MTRTPYDEAGTNGTTTIPIGKIFDGPYVVTIDAITTDDFQATKDQATGENMMIMNYHHSTHQVTIIGTNVVPEFPVGRVQILQ